MNQAIASSRNRNDVLLLKRVVAALQRLKDEPHDFGNCSDCGEEIPLPRLKAMPYAELCVDCQQKRDPPRGVRAQEPDRLRRLKVTRWTSKS